MGNTTIGTTPKERHSRAMDLVEQAMASTRPGKAWMLYSEAFQIERDIAEAILQDDENEPSRSIMYRSAASIALMLGKGLDNDNGLLTKAKEMALEGLAGCTASCVAQELFDVYQDANNHLQKQGD